MGSRAGLEVMEKGKSYSCPESNPNRPVRRYTDRATTAPHYKSDMWATSAEWCNLKFPVPLLEIAANTR
jgi:hypothetical protein